MLERAGRERLESAVVPTQKLSGVGRVISH